MNSLPIGDEHLAAWAEATAIGTPPEGALLFVARDPARDVMHICVSLGEGLVYKHQTVSGYGLACAGGMAGFLAGLHPIDWNLVVGEAIAELNRR